MEATGPGGEHLLPDLIDLNMGCPVRKVMKTGAGSALLADPDRAVAVARAAVQEAAGAGLPVTVKLRSGVDRGRPVAVELSRRLEQEAGWPRSRCTPGRPPSSTRAAPITRSRRPWCAP